MKLVKDQGWVVWKYYMYSIPKDIIIIIIITLITITIMKLYEED